MISAERVAEGGVDHWVFDLDNTLYPAECNLFAEIDARMAAFIENLLTIDAPTARKLQKEYYVRYGTTLSGLMTEHGVKPEDFMDYVHDIDLSVIARNDMLRAHIDALPGRKFIFTNGSVKHAERVSAALGLANAFDDIFDIQAAAFTPKPHLSTYKKFIARHEIVAGRAAMFEDLAHNLEAAHALGMSTVLVCSNASWFDDEPDHKRPARPGDRHDHVHHVTDDLTGFLGELIKTSADNVPSVAPAKARSGNA